MKKEYNMNIKLKQMFTQNDVTVHDVLDYFDLVKDLDVDYYGLKEVGLAKDNMREVVNAIQSTGKEVFLKVVKYEEDEIEGLAKIVLELDLDYHMGIIYYPFIWDIIDKKIRYLPFCGKIYGRPLVLDSTIEEIAYDAKRLEETGVDGFDILAYRYKYPDKTEVLIARVREVVSIVSAGCINSFDRLEYIISQGIWDFSIGGAFFKKRFVSDGSYRDNVVVVVDRRKG